MARIRKPKAGTTKGKPDIFWNVAVYIRLSRDDGSEESESVINQKRILSEYLNKYFEGNFSITDFYVDDGLTGTDDTRENFMRLIGDIERGKVNCMVCKTLSRAFRNYSDQGYYLEYYFPQKNVRFISTQDPKIDTYKNPEAMTGLEVPITGLMNDRFAAQTSNAVRRTFDTKRREGDFIGAFPPYGYLKDPANKSHLIIDEDIAPIKRDMLNWVIRDGMSLRGVTQRLNELGIPNPTSYKRSLGMKYCNPKLNENDGLWSPATVKRILLDKMNLGHMVQGRQKVVSYKVHDKVTVPEEDWYIKENTHEPTFTQEDYDKLVNLLERDTRTANGEKIVHLFSGFLKCKDCGKALQRAHAKSFTYYTCRTFKEKSKTKCTKHSIRIDVLENAVLKAIQAQIALVESISQIVDEINKKPVVDTSSIRIEKLLADKKKELLKTKQFSDGLYMDFKNELITMDDYRRMKDKFEEQLQSITSSIANLEEEQHLIGNGVKSEDSIFESFLKYKNITSLDRNILVELVDTIFVHEDKQISIKFSTEDELKRIAEFVKMNTNEGDLLETEYFFAGSFG
jgi:DNA invertase Pin-like site-specific DNA recombinase